MATKKITDLVELISAASGDVLPIVDISDDITKKIQVSNFPISTAAQTAIDAKQDTLVSGTNIKTINSTSLLGSGDVAVQQTLVSGTNIKTLNSESLLGSGNIEITASPSGVAGAIQFSDGSAFASDAANLFWDDTNNRLGVGTNAPTNTTEIQIPSTYGAIGSNANLYLTSALTSAGIKMGANGGNSGCTIQATQGAGGGSAFNLALNPFGGSVNVGNSNLGASLGIKGSGTTSATTSLLVQNSAGQAQFVVRDDGVIQTPYIRLDSNGSGRGRMTGVEQINGTSGAGGTRFCTNPDGLLVNASAQLQVDSTTKGFLPPRMTTTQKNAISSPASGLMVYDTDTNKLCCYNGTSWNDLF
jgi:hypothetical protein